MLGQMLPVLRKTGVAGALRLIAWLNLNDISFIFILILSADYGAVFVFKVPPMLLQFCYAIVLSWL